MFLDLKITTRGEDEAEYSILSDLTQKVKKRIRLPTLNLPF